MPISEDEFESRVHSSNPLAYHHYHQQQLQMAMSKAEQRKNNKPIMEKKRRARINNCLNELKSLILDAMKKDPARHSKLEKADILEMTVRHLQSVQKQQLSVAMAADPTVVHKFKTGFSECATEVNRFIGRLDGIDAGLKQRLVAHLGSCVTGLQQMSPYIPAATTTHTPTPQACPSVNHPLSLDDLNNNRNDELQRLQALSGIQLIPSRLPTGEFAFVLPKSATSALDSPSLGSHGSAFTAVHKDDDPKESELSPSSASSSPVFDAPGPVGNPEVTSTTLDQFKIPQRNFNKSLMKNKIVYQSQAAKLRAEEGLLKEVTNFPRAAERKYEDKRDLFARSFLTSQKLQALTVITSEERGFGSKNPLDFSMKRLVDSPGTFSVKREYDGVSLESPGGLLVKSEVEGQSSPVPETHQSDDSGERSPSVLMLPKLSSGGGLLKRYDTSPDGGQPEAKRPKLESSGEESDSSPRPKSGSSPLSSSTLSVSTLSTSTLSTSSGSSSAEKDSMWRPW